MRTELRVPDVPVTPGEVTILEIEVGNTSEVIDGVTARVEGLDPSWVHLPVPVLSLFPDSTGVLPIHVRFPPTTTVGDYLVVVHVESTIDPTRHRTHDLWLQVEPIEAASMKLRPSIVTGGRAATFAAVVTNSGNVATDFTIGANDETRLLDCEVEPLTLTVAAATSSEAEVRVRGPRPWFGQPLARMIVITASTPTTELRELATFNQKPRIPRGVLTAALLAGIVGLWASMFLFGIDLLRGTNDPTKAVADNFNSGGVQEVPLEAVAGSVAGKVTAVTTGDGLERITVEAYRETPSGPELTGSAATADDGTYQLGNLLPGTYTLRFTAEGFDERWYPAGTSAGDAADVRVDPKEEIADRDVRMTGEPGALVGTVLLPESAEPGAQATVTVRQVVERATRRRGPPPPAPIVVRTAGPIEVPGLVTPATYTIRVAAAGFERQDFEETLEGGETRVLNTVRLGAAAGSITGTVRSSTGEPLGNVEVVVQSGELEKKATTPTAGNVGTYLVDGLETPRTYVLTFTREGFSGQTIALDLQPGEPRTGVDAVLTGGTGQITGQVTGPDGQQLGGVTVNVTRGEFVASTATLTTGGAGAGVGSYTVSDIPVPGIYAVTFQRTGFLDETRIVGFLTAGVQSDISVQMRSSRATIGGTVSTSTGPVDGVTVVLTDGRTNRTTSTASTPNGAYTFTELEPGTYTLTFQFPELVTRILLVRVVAGDDLTRDVTMRGGGS